MPTPLTIIVVVGTANHYWMDAIVAMALFVLALPAALFVERHRRPGRQAQQAATTRSRFLVRTAPRWPLQPAGIPSQRNGPPARGAGLRGRYSAAPSTPGRLAPRCSDHRGLSLPSRPFVAWRTLRVVVVKHGGLVKWVVSTEHPMAPKTPIGAAHMILASTRNTNRWKCPMPRSTGSPERPIACTANPTRRATMSACKILPEVRLETSVSGIVSSRKSVVEPATVAWAAPMSSPGGVRPGRIPQNPSGRCDVQHIPGGSSLALACSDADSPGAYELTLR